MSESTLQSMPHSSAAESPRTLKIGGITPFTATDYPGELAAVLFVQGCPWRCGYCHNTHLQPRTADGAIPWTKVLDFLHQRIELIDAVVFSGGEPAIDPALTEAIWTVRKLGFKVGMHSAGIYPDKLEEVLPWLDWIGLDIKAPFANYERITGVAGSGVAAFESAKAVLASGIDYEFRTTVHPGLLDEEEIASVARDLFDMGARNYALQVFRSQGCINGELNVALPLDYPSQALQQRLKTLFRRFVVRKG